MYTLGVAPVDARVPSDSDTLNITVNGTTAGHSMIVCVRWYDPGGAINITSVAVSGESNATLRGAKFNCVGNTYMQFATIDSLSAGGNKTVTVTMSGTPTFSGLAAFAMTVAGGAAAGIFGGTATVSGSGTPAQISVNPTINNAMIVVSGTCSSADEGAVNTGYTGITLLNLNTFDHGQYKLDVGASGARNVQFPDDFGSWGYVAMWLAPEAAAVDDTFIVNNLQ